MENTVKVLFEDNAPHWYIALGDKYVGPMSASDVYEKVLSAEISWAHYVWKPGQAEWKRLCDVKTFQVAVPSQPSKSVQAQVKSDVASQSKPSIKRAGTRKSPPPAPSKSGGEERDWFLHYNDSQFGPFSFEEVSRFIKIGKIHGRVHAWKDGMAQWQRLEKIAEFDDAVAASRAAKESKSSTKKEGKKESEKAKDQRSAPRRPLVARIMLANDDSVTAAICRDISIGGMQVLTDRIPGAAGARIKLNVSPSGEEKGRKIRPFVAEGAIVRILEDGRGFSFRFERLGPEAKRAIEEYIADAND